MAFIDSREFEEAINGVESVQVQLGNSGYLNQDCTPDALNLYESLITSYKWTDNVYCSQLQFSILYL